MGRLPGLERLEEVERFERLEGEAILPGLPLWRHTVFGFRFLSLTCASKVLMTSTAMFNTPSLVCGLSLLFGFSIIHTRPSSLRASLISLILILSRALLLNLLPIFFSGSSSPPASLPASLSVFFLFPPPLLDDIPALLEDVTLELPVNVPGDTGEFE